MADASTQFFPQANNFNASLGQIMGQFGTAMVEMDAKAKQDNANVTLSLVQTPDGKPRPPIDFTSVVNGDGGKPLISTDISVPLISVVDNTSFLAQSATLQMDMEVSSHAEDNSSLQAEIGAEGTGKIGYGPFSASVKISAKTSVSKESKRSSDYTSKTHAELTFGRQPVPEGLMVILDALTDTVKAGIDIQKAKAADALQKAAESDNLVPSGGGSQPAPQPSGGGNGGGGNGGDGGGN